MPKKKTKNSLDLIQDKIKELEEKEKKAQEILDDAQAKLKGLSTKEKQMIKLQEEIEELLGNKPTPKPKADTPLHTNEDNTNLYSVFSEHKGDN